MSLPFEMSKLYDQHIMTASGKMFRYAYTILKDESSAHDVVQECLAKIWNKRDKLNEIQNHEAWAMRITRNQCYDWVRMNRFSILSEEQVDTVDPVLSDQDTMMKDQQKWLEQVLATLPAKQKEVFHLREFDGMSYQEISEILSLSLDEVKVNLHRARKKIRSILIKIESYGIAN